VGEDARVAETTRLNDSQRHVVTDFVAVWLPTLQVSDRLKVVWRLSSAAVSVVAKVSHEMAGLWLYMQMVGDLLSDQY